jgi:hypothetical protein
LTHGYIWAEILMSPNDKAFLLPYEELVRQPRQTLAAVFKYLELEANPAFIEEILQRTFA